MTSYTTDQNYQSQQPLTNSLSLRESTNGKSKAVPQEGMFEVTPGKATYHTESVDSKNDVRKESWK